MEAPTLTSALLSCGYLDAEYFLRLTAAYDLDLFELMDDVAEYRGDNGQVSVNDLIGVALERVAQTFLTQVVKRRADRFSSTEYTVWTNCLDS